MTPTPLVRDRNRRDIAVIGGSAGSIEALRDLVPQLPRNLPVAVFIVVHVLPSHRSHLPEILDRLARVQVRHAVHGDRIEAGRVLVAPPDQHLLLHPDHVELNRGPRENSTRPAVDPLFRSAGTAFGSRACGAVLSGHLDDGSEGLRLLAAAGGLALVQDPREALHPEMPRNALALVPAAEALTAAQLGQRIGALGRGHGPAGERPARSTVFADAPARPLLDVQVGAAGPGGVLTGLTCPECGGVLWAEPASENLHCRVGHRYSLEALQQTLQASVEQAMWAAVRALREDASLARHMATRAHANRSPHTAARFEAMQRTAERHAEVLEHLLLDLQPAEDEL